MKRTSLPQVFVLIASIAFLSTFARSQQASPGIAATSTSQATPSNVIAFSDSLPGQADGAVTATFALYADAQSTTPAWTETQAVQVAQGKYSVLLGSATANGIPADVFAADQAHWLGVQINGSEKRYLLVSVPYAMKAMEAERLGGMLPSEFVTTAQLQAALQSAASPSSATTTGGGVKTASGPVANASLNPPEPATDFTDNNTSEVLLVTQQGTGFAIHAISAGDAALFGENNTQTGTAVKALASATSGANIGLLAQSASPNGIAGVFDNIGSGRILSLRSNGNEVSSVDSFGNFTANQVNANFFSGSGAGLFNIPNSATTATTSSTSNTIVLRDNAGGITGNQIFANNYFAGSGQGLFNIPNSATTATTANNPNTIVLRDNSGGINVNNITASFISGNGSGLFNIPNSATTATTLPSANTIVLRDTAGGITANQITGSLIFGNGSGLFNIPNSATTATSAFTPNTIVARDANGSFSAMVITTNYLNMFAGRLTNTGGTDFSSGSETSPVQAVLSANTPGACNASKDLIIKTDAIPGQQLFICNATGNGWVLVGDGTGAGVTSVGAGDGSVAIGGTAAAPTVAVANGGITSAKLAPNAVTGSIADGSLSPAKTAGIAATLSGSNVFSGTQTMPNLTVAGSLSAGTATISGAFSASNGSGTGIHGDGAIGVDASSNAVGLQVRTTGTDESAIAATFTNSQPGKTISAGISSGNGMNEQFNVDTFGNVFAAGALTAPYTNGGGVNFAQLVKLQPNSTSSPQPVVPTTTADQGGAIGIVTITAGGNNGPLIHVAYAGVATCQFDATPTPGDYVGISHFTAGACTDLGSSIPTVPQRQLIGRVVGATTGNFANVLLFGPERFNGNGTVSSIFTGAGLQGGPITGSGTISIGFQSVTNNMLQNNSVTVSPGLGLSGGGTVPLGGSIILNNTGALSFNGRTGSIFSQPGDYSFGEISGTLASNQLPASLVYNNQTNIFTTDQTINGALSTNSLTTNSLTASSLTVNVPNQTTARINGTAISGWPVFSIFDTGAASTGATAFFAASSHNLAAQFQSSGPDILSAGTLTGNVLDVSVTGVAVFGNVTAQAFSGDGSALTNVNASSLGGTALANLATASALNAETTARQSGDTTLQSNINSESAARQSGDASLAASISAETAARQADTNNLQTSINNVSAADAKLATANTFTASNTFTGGTQDFSAAGATLPVRALPSAQTPSTCVASKELLIKTDAPAGQQLFVCGAGGTSWNLVGGGASGGVTSFNGRNGTVSPNSGDYSFGQISGSLTTSQLPALTGDVTEAAGSGFTLLTSTGVTAGSYTKVSVDLKGRVASGTQAAFSDIAGSATQSQLPVNVVYNNQVNTFSQSQTVNGTLTATSFTGNGGGLSNVNAAALNGLASSSFAQLAASSNTFTGGVTAASFSGNGSALTNVNAATVNNLQMLKVSASITPANVGNESCTEQSFTVSGVNSGDVLLSVQPSGHSPGTNIAIGGWRVSAANTVAIQFCNVSRSNSTPNSGTYSFALMR